MCMTGDETMETGNEGRGFAPVTNEDVPDDVEYLDGRPARRCVHCGTVLSDDMRFCTNCSQPVGDFPEGGAAETPNAVMPPIPPAPNNRNNLPYIIAAAIAALVIVIVALTQCGGDGGESTSTSALESSGGGSSAVAVKSSLQEYSWDEIAQISDEIAAAGDQAGAIKVAKQYNLTNSKGKLDGSQTKFLMVNGEEQSVRIIGFAHDAKSDGGTAGITFQFVNCIGEHNVNNIVSNAGGWEDSKLRAWLNGDMYRALPEEVRTHVVAVDKSTNNVGKTNVKKATAVSATSDKLWALSRHEIYGDGSYKVLNAEGEQYQLFKDMKVDGDSPNTILQKLYNGAKAGWWMRSPSAAGDRGFFDVTTEGQPNLANTNIVLPVAPCFCI